MPANVYIHLEQFVTCTRPL